MFRMFAAAIALLLPGASFACLVPQGQSGPIPAVGIDLHVPMRVLVSAGGEHVLPCEGSTAAESGVTEDRIHLTRGPTASFDLSGMAPHILAVRAFSDCPIRLIVAASSGSWHFGRDPRQPAAEGHGQELYVWAPGDGVLRVWVGTVSPDTCPGEVELETYDH